MQYASLALEGWTLLKLTEDFRKQVIIRVAYWKESLRVTLLLHRRD